VKSEASIGSPSFGARSKSGKESKREEEEGEEALGLNESVKDLEGVSLEEEEGLEVSADWKGVKSSEEEFRGVGWVGRVESAFGEDGKEVGKVTWCTGGSEDDDVDDEVEMERSRAVEEGLVDLLLGWDLLSVRSGQRCV
jgi:hypothetical protein